MKPKFPVVAFWVALSFSSFLATRPAVAVETESLDSKNLERLRLDTPDVLLLVKSILADRQSSVEDYNIAHTGKPPEQNGVLQAEFKAKIMSLLPHLSELFRSENSSFQSSLEPIDRGCHDYFERQIKATENIDAEMDQDGSRSLPFMSSELSQQVSLNSYEYYFLTLSNTSAGGGGLYVESLGLSYNCLHSSSSRKQVVQISTELAVLFGKLTEERYGIPAFVRGEGMTSALAEHYRKYEPMKVMGKSAVIAGATIAGYFVGIGALKTLFDLGRVGVLVFNASYGAATAAAQTYNDDKYEQLNRRLSSFATVSPETVKAMEALILTPKKVDIDHWYGFVSMVEGIRFRSLLERRKGINALCRPQKHCSPNQLADLSKKTRRQIEEAEKVLVEKTRGSQI